MKWKLVKELTHTLTPSLTGSFPSSRYLLLGLCIWLGVFYFLLFQHTFVLCSSGACYGIILSGVTSSGHWSTLNADAWYHIERCVCVLSVCIRLWWHIWNLKDRLPPLLSQPLAHSPVSPFPIPHTVQFPACFYCIKIVSTCSWLTLFNKVIDTEK